MSNDFDQFHEIFFEESFEGLDVMESGLLDLEPGQIDKDSINAIFRVAHSVKGGSGMFGFTEITNLTHTMETLLDQMRSGDRQADKSDIDLLLASVDCLRDMLSTQKNGEEQDQQQISAVQQGLEALLAGPTSTTEPAQSVPVSTVTEATEDDHWQITFAPHTDMLRTGNDPVLMFKVLEMSGPLDVQVDLSRLPDFSDLDPQNCFMGWTLTLPGNVHREDIEEVFDWVEGDCELDISLGNDHLSSSVKSSTNPDAIDEPPGSEPDPSTESSTPTEGTTEHVTDFGKEGRLDTGQTTTAENRRNPDSDRRQKDRRTSTPAHESGSIRVNIDKIDDLINLVGELVITQSMLGRFSDQTTEQDIELYRDGLEQLERNTRELQDSVMQIRMLPISFSFNRFPRLVRDICGNLGKKAELVLSGEQTEVDKTVLEKISDPLVHLVRNSLDHGLETPEVRLAAGKPETGTLLLNAFHEGGNIVIEISDDGAGLNRELILAKARERGLIGEHEDISDQQVYNLIFQPGFSTANTLSDLSGRGVGMDVVRRNIRDLGGNVSIQSETGLGSTVTIRLPLTMAILDGQLVKVGMQTYIVSLVSIVESMQVTPQELSRVNGQAELFKLRDEYIPIVRLHALFGIEDAVNQLADGLLVVVEADHQKVGLFVDDLLGQQQVVVKSLETNFRQIQGISGATILGDGRVALILDVAGLIRTHFEQVKASVHTINAAA
jgi:two-component system chemotaxis sensor kinase CheA